MYKMLIEDLGLGYIVEFTKCYNDKCSCVFCDNGQAEGVVRSINHQYRPIEAELEIKGTNITKYKLSQSDLDDPHIVSAVYKPIITYEKIKENRLKE